MVSLFCINQCFLAPWNSSRDTAITSLLANGSNNDSSKNLQPPFNAKRPFTPLYDDEEFDSENVDPELFSSKRSKGSDGTPSKKSEPLLRLNVAAGQPYGKIPAAISAKPTTPTSTLLDRAGSTPNAFVLPSGISSAPAGRSPKHKRIGLLSSKKRHSLSPFKRVEPPVLGSRKSGSGLPFSIDAALNGTLSKGKAPVSSTFPTSALIPTSTGPLDPLTIEGSMPKGWFFDIHEDTPDEEAANLMEHSTGILDISSDDEAGPSKKDQRGKENIPPTESGSLIGANGNEVAQITMKKDRRSYDPDAMKDVDEERLPLGALPAEDFYGHGLDDKSVEVVKPEQDEETGTEATPDHQGIIAESQAPGENCLPEALVSQPCVPPDSTITQEKMVQPPSFEIAVDGNKC